MALVQLFYVSRATTQYDNEGVRQILATSRVNNFRDDITGCLLFSGSYFAQVLEGTPEVTSGRLDAIAGDPRHTDFRLLLERRVDQRSYGEWSMGYLHDLGLEDELAALLNGTGTPGKTLVDVMARMRPDSVMGALR